MTSTNDRKRYRRRGATQLCIALLIISGCTFLMRTVARPRHAFTVAQAIPHVRESRGAP